MKILTIGGGFVAEHLPYEVVSARINSEEDVANVIKHYKPNVIVNCIGKTGRPNVDWCESHKEETAFANVAVPIMLAKGTAAAGVHLVQIGSGCIYFGPSPCKGETSGARDPGWREDDFANPKSFYSKTKYACDLMLGSLSHVTTLRIRMPISTQNTSRNLINKLKGYKQVIDIPNSVTFMSDLTRCVDWAIKGSHTGIFHVTNPEPITAAQVMQEYQKYVPSHTFEIIDEAQLDSMTVAKRSNCIIDSSKLKRAGFHMTPSQEALENCMAEYAKNI
jgi:dTDP-4-dehydrorhamnose reductase